MKVVYDRAADAAYVYLQEIREGQAVQQREVDPGIVADFDAEGRLLGLEVLEASRRLAPEVLASAEDGAAGPTRHAS